MKKSILIICLFFAAFTIAQPPSKFYTKFGGSGIDIGYGVKQTFDKGYIVAGSTTSFGAGASDVYLVKVDSMGWTTWMKSFGGFGNDVGRSVIQLSDTGYVIAGFTNSFGNGGYDAYIIRTDKNGNLKWQKTFGGPDWDFAYDLTKASDGTFIVAGSTYNFGYGGKDGLLLNYDTSGVLIWEKFYGGVNDDEFKAVTTKNGTEFFAAGETKSYGESNGDMYSIKFALNGDSLMTLTFGGTSYDFANEVIVDKYDRTILLGGSKSYSNGKTDALFVNFTNAGAYMAHKNHGLSTEDEEFYCSVPPQLGNLDDAIAVFSTKEVTGYKNDVKTIFLDGLGNWWGGFNSGTFGFSGDDEVFDIAVTNQKGYVQVGYTTSLNALDKDVFLIKRDSTLAYGSSIVNVADHHYTIKGLTVYPNPLPDQTQLQVTSELPLKRISIFDATGKKLEDFVFTQKEWSAKLDILYPSGFYFLQVENGISTKQIKVIKQ